MSWADTETNNNTEKKEIEYLKFEEGVTVLRILDEEPLSRWTHWIKEANGGKGVGIYCTNDKTCPICKVNAQEKKEGLKPSERTYRTSMSHSINVLVKTVNGKEVNKVMVLEKGNGLFGQLHSQMAMLSASGLSPDLRLVDLIINKTGTGLNTKYTVMPNMRKIYSLDDSEMKLEKYDLEQLKPALTAEQITDLMGGANFNDVIGTNNDTENEVASSDTNADIDIDFTQPE